MEGQQESTECRSGDFFATLCHALCVHGLVREGGSLGCARDRFHSERACLFLCQRQTEWA